MKILVIIPAYNEQANIGGVIKELQEAQPEADYLVVNDGSTDGTQQFLLQNSLSHVTLPINMGIGAAVQTGYLYAKENGYDIAIQMDGDGQHDPAYLGKLITAICNGEADMVIGSRFLKGEGFQSTKMRQAGISILRTLIRWLCGAQIMDATSGLRACNRDLICYFADNYAQDYPEPEAILAATQEGYKVKEVSVQMRERSNGTSSITGFKSAYYMIKVSLALVVNRMMDRGNGRRQN